MNPPTDYAAQLAAVERAYYLDTALFALQVGAILTLAAWALLSLPWSQRERDEVDLSLARTARACREAIRALTE
jgi:hypothetical protein